MQTCSLGLARGLAPFQGKRGRAAASRRQPRRAAVRVAAAGEDTDLGSLLRDALATPAKPQPAAPAPAPPAPAPIAAPAPTTAASPPAASVTVDPVPGTELLSGPAQPQPPPEPSQGFDFVLEQLQAKPPGFGQPVAAAKSQVAVAEADSVGDGLAAAGKGLGDAGAAATKGLADAADSVADAFGGAADSVNSALGGAADSVGSVLGGVGDAAADAQAAAAAAAAEAAAAAAAAADAVTGALSGALGGATGALSGAAAGAAGGAVGAAQQFLEGAAAEFNTEVGIIKDNIDSLVGGVQAAVDSATGGVSSQISSTVSGVAGQLSSLLPPEARDALAQAAGAASGAVKQLSGTDPATAAVLAGVGLGLPALAVWNASYGGYAGVLEPEDAFQVLQTQDAVLLDCRTEAERVARGTVELRRGALGKGAAVPPVRLPPSVSKRIRNAGGVALEMQALEAAALARVNPGSTKVIVMDCGGEAAKTLARALRAAGVRRPYVLAGGYKGWQAAGLAVREKASEYETSPLDAISDTAESVAEVAASRLSGLREPKNAVVAGAALGGLGYLALNFHTTLQFIGVLGLELSIISRALTYSSLDDAFEDVSSLYKNAVSLASAPLKAAEALQGRAAAAARQQQQAAGNREA